MPNDASAYANIPIDAVRKNTTPFRVRLANTFTCGKPVALTLHVTTAQGSASIDLTIPTGGPGAQHPVDSNDVPKAIPDLGTATSQLVLTGASTITDLNVRVGQITHAYDSDLKISLIGPDATTVVLANRLLQAPGITCCLRREAGGGHLDPPCRRSGRAGHRNPLGVGRDPPRPRLQLGAAAPTAVR